MDDTEEEKYEKEDEVMEYIEKKESEEDQVMEEESPVKKKKKNKKGGKKKIKESPTKYTINIFNSPNTSQNTYRNHEFRTPNVVKFFENNPTPKSGREKPPMKLRLEQLSVAVHSFAHKRNFNLNEGCPTDSFFKELVKRYQAAKGAARVMSYTNQRVASRVWKKNFCDTKGKHLPCSHCKKYRKKSLYLSEEEEEDEKNRAKRRLFVIEKESERKLNPGPSSALFEAHQAEDSQEEAGDWQEEDKNSQEQAENSQEEGENSQEEGENSQEEEEKEDRLKVNCSDCSHKTYTLIRALRRHIKKEHGGRKLTEVELKSFEYKCKSCGSKVTKNIHKHKEYCPGLKEQCPHCYVWQTKANMRDHVKMNRCFRNTKEKENEDEVLVLRLTGETERCRFCNKLITTQCMKRHIITLHRDAKIAKKDLESHDNGPEQVCKKQDHLIDGLAPHLFINQIWLIYLL